MSTLGTAQSCQIGFLGSLTNTGSSSEEGFSRALAYVTGSPSATEPGLDSSASSNVLPISLGLPVSHQEPGLTFRNGHSRTTQCIALYSVVGDKSAMDGFHF